MATRTMLSAMTVVALTAWSLDSQAQLQPPPPMPQQMPPGATPPMPAWGFPPAQPTAPMPAPNTTAQRLDASDTSGSFRGLEIAWVNLGAGGGYVSTPSKLGYGKSGTGGPAFDLGFGGRFVTWTLGLRARVMPMSSFTLVQAMLEAGYHLPMGAWDPYVNIRGGYATALSSGTETIGGVNGSTTISLPNAKGGDVGLSVGDDYYLSALFSLGLDASFDALVLSRGSASAVGFVVVGSLHAGLHFDL